MIALCRSLIVIIPLCLVCFFSSLGYAKNTGTANSIRKQKYLSLAEDYLKTHPKIKASLKLGKAGNSTISVVDNNGVAQEFVVDGTDRIKQAIGSSCAAMQDKTNLINLYKMIYNNIPSTLRDKYKITASKNVSKMSVTELKQKIYSLVGNKALGTEVRASLRVMTSSTGTTTKIISTKEEIKATSGVGLNSGYKPDYTYRTEHGWELGTDATDVVDQSSDSDYTTVLDGDDEIEFSVNGLISNVNFPLRDYMTSVKRQGARGTCQAFAMTSAVEASVAYKYHYWDNFSEQSLYWFGKIYTADDYAGHSNEGLDPFDVLVAADDEDYAFQWESTWNYNPSSWRTPSAKSYSGGQWEDSCAAYEGEMCYDTTHQGASLLWSKSSIAAYGVPYYLSAYDNGNFKIDQTYSFWNGDYPSASVAIAEWVLDSGHPIVIALYPSNLVTLDGKKVDAYIDPAGIGSYTGGHGMTIMGYVRTEDIPTKYRGIIPTLIPTDDIGGGYFIVKGTWGQTYGDQGYFYIPYSWAEKYVFMMVTFTVYK